MYVVTSIKWCEANPKSTGCQKRELMHSSQKKNLGIITANSKLIQIEAAKDGGHTAVFKVDEFRRDQKIKNKFLVEFCN